MKYQIALLSFILIFDGCGKRSTSNENIQEKKSQTAVTLTHAVLGKIEKKMMLSATTVYQNKSVVTTPIPAFISKIFVQPGTRVKSGQILCQMESKEQHALGNDRHTFIPIKAGCDGIVLDVQQQAGNYVIEGTIICTIAETSSLAFEINVPYEKQQYTRDGSKCVLELPDKTQLQATIHAPLAEMNTASQSERVIAQAKSPFLPEGMNVKAIFTIGHSTENMLILPKSAVQSDETLTRYWVMKLSSDSTVAKVPVEIGNSNISEIEIKSTILSPQDNIVLTGGYGLEDGMKITITKEEETL